MLQHKVIAVSKPARGLQYWLVNGSLIPQNRSCPPLYTAVCTEFVLATTVGPTIDNYLATVADGVPAKFSGTFLLKPHDHALKAISQLLCSRPFNNLPSSVRDTVVQEMMKYSIQYLDRSTVRVVKLETRAKAEAFDNRIATVLSQLKWVPNETVWNLEKAQINPLHGSEQNFIWLSKQ